MLSFVARFVSVCAVLILLQKGVMASMPAGRWPLIALVMSFGVPFLAAADIGAALMSRIGRRPGGVLALSVTLMATYMALHEFLAVMFREVPVVAVAAREEHGLLMLAFITVALAGVVRAGLAVGARFGRIGGAPAASSVPRTSFAFGAGTLSLSEVVLRFLIVCVAMAALHAMLAFVAGMRSPVLAFAVPIMAGALAAGDHAARRAGVQLQGVQAWLVAVIGASFHVLVQFALIGLATPFGWLGSFDVIDTQIAVAFAPVAIAMGAVLARICLPLGARFAAGRRLDKRAADC